MTTAIRESSPQATSFAVALPPEKVDLLRRTICAKLSNDEFELFGAICVRTGLDPIAKQIYAIKRGDKVTIQTGIDGYRLVAERTGKYVPGREPTYTYAADGKLVSATAYVKKLTGGQWHEVSATAYFDEYYPGDQQGAMWRKMPHVMIAKCAEALVIRKAFPQELGNVYVREELDQADTPAPASVRVVQTNRPAVADKGTANGNRSGTTQADAIFAGHRESIRTAPTLETLRLAVENANADRGMMGKDQTAELLRLKDERKAALAAAEGDDRSDPPAHTAEPTTSTGATAERPSADEPVGAKKLPEAVAKEVYVSLLDAGIKWPGFIVQSPEVIGRQLGNDDLAEHLTLDEAGRVREWAKGRKKAGGTATPAGAAA